MDINSLNQIIMEMSIKTIISILSVLISGLSAGFFYSWSVSVIPGTQRIPDNTYLETMQSINRAILNPAFFIVFFGTIFSLAASGFLAFSGNKLSFALFLTAFLIYLIGTFGVTGMGNVPLNDQLDQLELSKMSIENLNEFRKHYEVKWNKLHSIRTVAAIITFLLAILASFFQFNNQ